MKQVNPTFLFTVQYLGMQTDTIRWHIMVEKYSLFSYTLLPLYLAEKVHY